MADFLKKRTGGESDGENIGENFRENVRENAGENTGENGRPPVILYCGIAVILILLILITVVIGRNRARQQQASLEASAAQAEEESRSLEASVEASVQASIEESLAAVPKLSAEECTDPSITELVKQYFACRLAGDTEGLLRLFGREKTDADANLHEKLQAQRSWIRSFDDITVRLLPGETENEKIGIVTYKINFRRVSAKAPGIMYFYITRGSDGSWVIHENLLKEKRDLIAAEFEEAGVQELIDENTAALRTALENDSSLALMYTSFLNGEIYSEASLTPDREPVLDLFTDPLDSEPAE